MKIVLIVEDDPGNNLIFDKILRKQGGLATKQSEDVEEILKIAAGGEADIVLMDVGLSNSYYQGNPVDGIRITQLLKANSQTANLPVILVTAFAMAGDRENFLVKSGADGFIPKPIVDFQEFIDRIRAYLPN